LISVHMYIGTQSEQGYLTDGVEGGEAIPDAVTGRTRISMLNDRRPSGYCFYIIN